MKGRLLILRPEPGASATAAAVRALGYEAVVAPLFHVGPLAWKLPADLPDAVVMTSANAARHGGEALAALTHLPLYAVGTATAAATREAGFTSVTAGEADAEAIFATARADGHHRLLHLAGREHRAPEREGPEREGIARRIVYASDAVEGLPEAAAGALPEAIALLHSPRAAALFAGFVVPQSIRIAALSPAVAEAAGPGWRAVAIAARPDDSSLLAAAAGLCDQRA